MKKNLLFVSALCALLCSCNDNNEVSQADKGQQVPLAVTSASVSTVETRAGDPVELTSDNAAIGLFLKAVTDQYTAHDNAKFIYKLADTKWAPALDADNIYLNNNAASVCAYYPYDAAQSTSAFTLTSQKDVAAKDLCYCPYVTTLTNVNEEATFHLVHAYSKITFSISRDVTYTGTCALSEIKIKDSDSKILQTATLNITDGTYTAGTADAVSYDPAISSIADVAIPAVTSVLMAPVTATAATTDFIFKVDGTPLTASVSNAALAKLEAGVNYKISVSIKGKAVRVTKVDVAPWTDSDVSGTLEPTVVN